MTTTSAKKRVTTLRLILGDQLNELHSWFATPRDDVVYVMMEVRQETDYVLHHAQKILAIFAAMREFAGARRAAGHRVDYLAIDDADNRQSLPENLDLLAARHHAAAIEYLPITRATVRCPAAPLTANTSTRRAKKRRNSSPAAANG
jgi:deoxyribodipyrimidine photolyase-related protein